MNTTFRLSGDYELEITSDGTLPTRNVNCGNGRQQGLIGIALHHTGFAFPPNEDGSPAQLPTPVNETKGSMFLRRSQARAIASALLSAVAEASGE